MIEVKKLSRRFGNHYAVRDLSFRVKKGEVFGLLGENGAGKTTTIALLTTLLRPTNGSATVCGFSLKQGLEIRKRIGVVFQESIADENLSGRENLELYADIIGADDVDEVLRLVALDGDKKVKEYSGGMRRRLDIARALLGNPEVLFLDEPTTNLDPLMTDEVWNHIRKLHNTTIVLSTNNMAEAERLCDRVLLLHEGKCLLLGTPSALKRKYRVKTLHDLFAKVMR